MEQHNITKKTLNFYAATSGKAYDIALIEPIENKCKVNIR